MMNRTIFSALLMALLSLAVFCSGCQGDDASASSGEDSVIFFSGGTIDDDSASVLLFTMDKVKLLGTIISNSDCIYRFSVQNQWRIQSYLDQKDYPINLSSARGWNPFPMDYRKDSIKIYNLDMIKDYPDNGNWPPYDSGEEFLARHLEQAIEDDEPITLLVTSPITPLSTVLQKNPELERGINRVVWMGGAINVPGNLDPTTIPPEMANPKAEWNAFWDPYAVDWIFKNTTFPLFVFPLDVTNQADLTTDFLDSLADQAAQYEYSAMVSGLYDLVKGEPYFEMWNTLTSVYLARPDIFEDPVEMSLGIETEGYMQGAISQVQGGRRAQVFLNIANTDDFYDYVLGQLRRN